MRKAEEQNTALIENPVNQFEERAAIIIKELKLTVIAIDDGGGIALNAVVCGANALKEQYLQYLG